MIEFQLLAGLRGVEKSIPNDNNLFPLTVSEWRAGRSLGVVPVEEERQNNLMD